MSRSVPRVWLFIATLMIAVASPTHASEASLTAEEAAMLPYFAEVMSAAGFGLRSVEAAAFLIRDPAHDVVCMKWPASPRLREQNYRGPVPGPTIAIVHTHPQAMQRPSRNDIEEAKRVGLPFYVVSRDSIWVAMPDGSVRHVLADAGWWRRAARDTTAMECMSTAQFVLNAAKRGVTLSWREARGE